MASLRRAAGGAVLLVLLGACSPGHEAGPADTDGAAHLSIGEVMSVPAGDLQGAAFAVAVHNDAGVPVRVREVRALPDDGVRVEVLGASTCRQGCPGAVNWRDGRAMVADSLEWGQRFVVPPDDDVQADRADEVKVLLHVYPADQAAFRSLADRCLYVRTLLIATDGEPLRPVRNPLGDYVVALDSPDVGRQGSSRGCEDGGASG